LRQASIVIGGADGKKLLDMREANMSMLTYAERKKCYSLIHGAAGSAALIGSGLAQLPMSDAVVITPIQIGMIISLGAVFGIEITESAAKGLFASLSASCIGRAASQVLFGWVPVLGNIVNAGTAAALTEAVGWLAVEHFQAERVRVGAVGAALESMTSNLEKIFSTGRKKWNRFWKKGKRFCKDCVDDWDEQFSD
jgi:uncharacterized protein (DUF697 family)